MSDGEVTRSDVARMIGAQLIGTAAGVALGVLLKPRRHHVALLNAAGLWTDSTSS